MDALNEIVSELIRKAAFAKDSLQNNDMDKLRVRLEQVQNLVNEAIAKLPSPAAADLGGAD